MGRQVGVCQVGISSARRSGRTLAAAAAGPADWCTRCVPGPPEGGAVTDRDSVLERMRRELAAVGTMAAGLDQRAAAVLDALGRVLPFDSGWLAVRDPERRRHVPLATTGA